MKGETCIIAKLHWSDLVFVVILERGKMFLIAEEILYATLTLLHSEQPKLQRVLAVLSAIGLIPHSQHYQAPRL